MPKLMWLLLAPFLAAIAAFVCPAISGKSKHRLAVAVSLIPFLMLLSFGKEGIGEGVNVPWLPSLSIQFNLRVDSLSLLFLYLTSLLIPIALLAQSPENLPFANAFYGLMFLLQGCLIGFFTAGDMVVFTIFWEAILLPLYFMMILWGKGDRRAAALQFLIYMFAGSCLMVAAVLALYLASATQGEGTFNLDALAALASQASYAPWIGTVFLLAFSVKTPLFPFHAWLPDAYHQASTSGTILLSALLSKAGIYGFLRVGVGLFPELMRASSPLLLGLAIAGVLYGGLAAWMQSDYKRLIAYSSFSHVNLILAGVFAWNASAHEGAIVQAFNHGITIAALFLVAGWLEERLGSTALGAFSGVAHSFPRLCWLTMMCALSSMALPGTNNFIGEFLIFFGLFGEHPWLTFMLGCSVILSAVYMLRWMQEVYFGTEAGLLPGRPSDLGCKELIIALPLVFLILWVGIYPAPLLKQVISMNPLSSVEKA